MLNLLMFWKNVSGSDTVKRKMIFEFLFAVAVIALLVKFVMHFVIPVAIVTFLYGARFGFLTKLKADLKKFESEFWG